MPLSTVLPVVAPVRAVAPLPMSQDVLAAEAVGRLCDAGFRAETGRFGDLATAEVPLAGGLRLVVLPMAETLWGDCERPDVDLWHVLARAADGTYLAFGVDEPWEDACPSVLWARRMGVDPAVALDLVRGALADENLCAAFGLYL